jgi:hypothetical protein
MVKNRLSHKERRKELTDYLETCGYYNINKSSLARKYHVSEAQIRSDFEHIMRDARPEDYRVILKKFDQSFSLALNTAINAISKASTTSERINCARCISSITSEYLGALRQLGYNIPEDGAAASSEKPSIQTFIDFLNSPKYKQLRANDKKTPLATSYDNINFRPSAAKDTNGASPQPQEKPLGESLDDLEEVTDEDLEKEEEETECQK